MLYTPVDASFSAYEVRFGGVFITRTCYRDKCIMCFSHHVLFCIVCLITIAICVSNPDLYLYVVSYEYDTLVCIYVLHMNTLCSK